MQTQISLYWLNELLDIRGYSLEFYVESLTINGFEVENCIPVGNGKTTSVALQFYITANRGYALSIRGIVPEFKFLLERFRKFKIRPHVLNVFGVKLALKRQIRFRRPTPTWGGKSVYKTIKLSYNRYVIPRNSRRRKRVARKQLLKLTTLRYIWRVENTVYRSPKWKPNRLYHKQPVFNSRDPKIFSKFLCFEMENFKDLSSPGWLRKKLIYSGITPQNSLIDYQNYILLEGGYPFEFYDLKKIRAKCGSNNFKLKLSHGSNSKFIGINNREYNINKETLVLKANEEILSVAGIIPNKEFGYTNETDSLLIEGAIFDPKMMMRQSRLLKLKTTRSNYYSRAGMNRKFFILMWYRFLLLIRVNNPHVKFKLHTSYYTSEQESLIYHVPFVTWYEYDKVRIFESWDFWLREKKLAQISGPIYQYLPLNRGSRLRMGNRLLSTHVEDVLYGSKISSKFRYLPGQDEYYPIIYGRYPQPPPLSRRWLPPRKWVRPARYWLLKIPKFLRYDLKTERDMIEEIIRLHGVDKVISIVPKPSPPGNGDLSYQIRKKITLCLLNEGFNELISYSLVNNNDNKIQLINPLAKEYSTLRTSLLPSLVQIISENIKQGNTTFEGFEYGHIFSKDSLNQYSEIECLSGIFGGIKLKSTWSDKIEDLSWFEAKGRIEKIFEKFDLKLTWQNLDQTIKYEMVHPYRTAKVYSYDQLLGIFGELNPILAKDFNVTSKFYLFEFNFQVLVHQLTKNLFFDYKPYSLYPKIIKDLSFIIDKSISFDLMKDSIYHIGGKYLLDITLLDRYEGDSILPNQASLCIQLTFQSDNQTLKNENIDLTLNTIISFLTSNYNAILR